MLHQVKKGVWEHLVHLTLEMIKSAYDARTANLMILELDIRICLVPRYYGLWQFPKGISGLLHVTAAEYQQLMWVCILCPFEFWSSRTQTQVHLQLPRSSSRVSEAF